MSKEAQKIISKVPEATVFFWIIKILTTGMGETASDYFATRFDPVIVVPIAFFALILAVIYQFRQKKYVPWIYWLAVSVVSIFGTMAADALHVLLGIPYVFSTLFYIIALAIIFYLWKKNEGTLSIHSIHTKKREGYYWAAVLTTFALGTATGDLTASTLHLGYFISGVMFFVAILIPTVGYMKFGWNAVFSFWFAYILTRPLGASFADWMGVPAFRSGLGWGTGLISLVLTLLIVILVAYVTVTHEDLDRHPVA